MAVGRGPWTVVWLACYQKADGKGIRSSVACMSLLLHLILMEVEMLRMWFTKLALSLIKFLIDDR